MDSGFNMAESDLRVAAGVNKCSRSALLLRESKQDDLVDVLQSALGLLIDLYSEVHRRADSKLETRVCLALFARSIRIALVSHALFKANLLSETLVASRMMDDLFAVGIWLFAESEKSKARLAAFEVAGVEKLKKYSEALTNLSESIGNTVDKEEAVAISKQVATWTTRQSYLKDYLKRANGDAYLPKNMDKVSVDELDRLSRNYVLWAADNLCIAGRSDLSSFPPDVAVWIREHFGKVSDDGMRYDTLYQIGSAMIHSTFPMAFTLYEKLEQQLKFVPLQVTYVAMLLVHIILNREVNDRFRNQMGINLEPLVPLIGQVRKAIDELRELFPRLNPREFL